MNKGQRFLGENLKESQKMAIISNFDECQTDFLTQKLTYDLLYQVWTFFMWGVKDQT